MDLLTVLLRRDNNCLDGRCLQICFAGVPLFLCDTVNLYVKGFIVIWRIVWQAEI